MADLNHVRILKQGRQVWNQWRADHDDARPDFVSANLCQGLFSGSDLRDADFTATNLRSASLEGSDLHNAMLLYANLCESDMRSTNLVGAMLMGADLSWANLKGAIFGDADLRGTDLSGADLSDADLSAARGLTRRQLRRAFINHNTRLPEHLAAARAGMRLRRKAKSIARRIQ